MERIQTSYWSFQFSSTDTCQTYIKGAPSTDKPACLPCPGTATRHQRDLCRRVLCPGVGDDRGKHLVEAGKSEVDDRRVHALRRDSQCSAAHSIPLHVLGVSAMRHLTPWGRRGEPARCPSADRGAQRQTSPLRPQARRTPGPAGPLPASQSLTRMLCVLTG